LPKPDPPKGEDCGVVVAGVCPNPNENPPDPETGVVVVVAEVLVWLLFTGNENLGVVVALDVLLVLAGALVVEVDVPFPNTLLGVSLELLPNALPPNTFAVWVCGNPKGEGLAPALFENAVVVVVLPPPNMDF